MFLALLFPLLLSLSANAQMLDRVVAVVVDQPILDSEIKDLQKDLQNSPALSSIYGMNKMSLGYDKLLDRMIEDKIVSYVVRDLEISVSEDEVDKQIERIAKQNRASVAQLQGSLKKEGIPYDLYRKNIRAQLERRNLFDRELRRGGGVTDAELRALYESRTSREFDMQVIGIRNNPKNRVKLLAIAKEIGDKPDSASSIAKANDAQSLGYMGIDALSPAFSRAYRPGAKSIGPVEVKDTLQLIIIGKGRSGNEEDFQKQKESLMGEAQAQTFERQFSSWLSEKKRQLNIAVNKL